MIRLNLKIFLCFMILAIAFSGCSSQEKADFELAKKEFDKGQHTKAVDLYERVIKRNSGSKITIEAAREAARISFYELKDYKKSAQFYKFIVLHSVDPVERLSSQKQVASIFFDDLQDYSQSIVEFSKLLEMPHSDLDETKYRLSLARAYFYLGNYFQALSEIDSLLKYKTEEKIIFDALTLKGNILVAEKDFGKAVEVFKTIMAKYPEKAIKENLSLTLAVCYEENNDFKNAIKTLEENKSKYSRPEHFEVRIKRLQERLKNAPGAKGFRK